MIALIFILAQLKKKTTITNKIYFFNSTMNINTIIIIFSLLFCCCKDAPLRTSYASSLGLQHPGRNQNMSFFTKPAELLIEVQLCTADIQWNITPSSPQLIAIEPALLLLAEQEQLMTHIQCNITPLNFQLEIEPVPHLKPELLIEVQKLIQWNITPSNSTKPAPLLKPVELLIEGQQPIQRNITPSNLQLMALFYVIMLPFVFTKGRSVLKEPLVDKATFTVEEEVLFDDVPSTVEEAPPVAESLRHLSSPSVPVQRHRSEQAPIVLFRNAAVFELQRRKSPRLALKERIVYQA
jgi:hypothetical protein